ncbi:MAG: hypothetical protein AAF602_29800, partial [Myxococcota bacterium]
MVGSFRTWSLALFVLGACTSDEFAERALTPDTAFMGVAGADGVVWAVGAQPSITEPPIILRSLDDGPLELVDNDELHALWWVQAWSRDAAMLAGGGSTVLEWDGTELVRMDTPGFGLQTIFGLWGETPDDVWAVGGFAGRDAFVWRYDGASWRTVDLPDDLPLTERGEMPSLFKVWGRASDDVWIVGGLGTVLHWNGEALSVVPSGTTEALFTVAGNDKDIVAVGGSAGGVVIRGGVDGFEDETPAGAPLLQGLTVDGRRTWIAGERGYAAVRRGGGDYKSVELGFTEPPDSVHAL